jgi:23S rRNA pseudouridine1911/1915/1917 synthase
MVKRAYPGVGSSDVFLPVIVKSHLQEGDVLRIKIYEANENAGEVIPSDIPIDIIYEDEDVILLNKPGDMVVHPSYAHHADSLSNGLSGYFGRTGQKHVIRTIGRLDRETSGLILFAKNRYSAAILSNQRENMSKRKEYLALAYGVFDEREGTVDAPIGRVEGDRMIRRVMEDGKRAVTHYRLVEQYEDCALIRLILDTGRTHQIRVHMAHIGHPLLGDSLYGKEIPDSHGMSRAALHAAHLEFAQPVSGQVLVFDAEMPQDMKDAMELRGKS